MVPLRYMPLFHHAHIMSKKNKVNNEERYLKACNKEQSTLTRLSEEAGMPQLSDNRAKLEAIMLLPAFNDYMKRSESVANTLHKIIDVMKQYNDQNKEDTKVTDEDLNNLVAPKRLASTIYNSNRAYYLYFTSSQVSPQYDSYRSSGRSVRLVKDAN